MCGRIVHRYDIVPSASCFHGVSFYVKYECVCARLCMDLCIRVYMYSTLHMYTRVYVNLQLGMRICMSRFLVHVLSVRQEISNQTAYEQT